MPKSPRRFTVSLGALLLLAASLAAVVLPGSALAASAPSYVQTIDGTWSQFPPVVRPDPTESSTSFYDAAHGRMLVFAGRAPGHVWNTLWSISLTGLPRWTQLTPLGSPPPARYAQSMVYDSARDRLLVFGGTTDGTNGMSDVWALTLSGTPTWSQLATLASPPPRFAHVAIYDPVGDRMIAFGGYGGVFRNDTWQLTLAGTPTWTQLFNPGPVPGPRDFSTAVYDPDGQRMVLVGGNVFSAGQAFPANDVCALNLSGTPAWTVLSPGGTPPSPRLAHESLYDPTRHRMVIFGGTDGGQWMNDALALDLTGGTSWSTIAAAGVRPSGRSGEAFVYDAAQDRAIVFAGKDLFSVFADGWTLSFSGTPTWSPLEPGPSARLAHRAVYDPLRKRVVLFAGIEQQSSGAQSTRNDTWALPLNGGNDWTQLGVGSALVPATRASHLVVGDPAHDRMLLFAGNNEYAFFSDLWSFDFASQAWTQLAPASPPGQRESMAGVYDAARSRLIVFGGWDGQQPLNEAWEMEFLPSPAWSPMSIAGPPPEARYGHTMVYDSARDRVLLFGGVGNFNFFGDVWALNLSGPPAWTLLTTTGDSPSARYGHVAMYDALRDRMIVFGGYDGSFVNSVYALNLSPATPTWSQLHPAGTPPSVRDFASGTYDPLADRYVIVGGNGPVFPPGGDTWALTWGDIPTPTLLSFADEQTGPGAVRLTWFTPAGPGQRAVAQRSADGAAWEEVATLTSDGSGEFVLEDAVAAGGRFDYRLGVGAPGAEEFGDGHWVTIPAGVQFGITGTGANPSRGAIAVSFALAQTGAASLDLYDIAGRRLVHRDITALGVGVHTLNLAGGRALGSGVYWIRLAQGSRVAQRKVAVVR